MSRWFNTIEVEVWRDGESDPAPSGLGQLGAYLAGLGQDSGWLVVFDRRSGLPPVAERSSVELATPPQRQKAFVIRA